VSGESGSWDWETVWLMSEWVGWLVGWLVGIGRGVADGINPE
jgi:hypothetical protein